MSENLPDQINIAEMLLNVRDTLPVRDRDAILKLGQKAVPALVDVLNDEALQMEDGPANGWAPIHAARLLGELRAEEAVPHLLRWLCELDAMAILHSEVRQALQAMGEPALQPLLDAYAEYKGNEEVQDSIAFILCDLGVQHDAVFSILKDIFERDNQMGAVMFGGYGDPQALPLLQQALDDFEVRKGATYSFSHHVVIELADAIERIGGELTSEQDNKLQRVKRLPQGRSPAGRKKSEPDRDSPFPDVQDMLDMMTPVRREQPKVGRNDPCWCGSGKKYKHCHWRSDHS